jgi:murein DD-endopeptidase MepM/ murein hydrolase activator NlpD
VKDQCYNVRKKSIRRLGARMKSLNLGKPYVAIQAFFTRSNLRTKAIFSVFKLWISKHLHTISWKSPKFYIGALAFSLVIGSAIIHFSGTASAAYIVVNGQKIGLVASVQKGQYIVDDILTKRGQAIGKVAKTHDLVEYKTVRVKTVELIDSMSTANELQKVLTSYIDGYALEIAGTQVVILPTQDDVQSLLKTYQNFYTKPSDNNQVTSVEFSESITTKPVEAQPDQVRLLDQALKELKDGKKTTTEYTAQKNDSWWLIARKNDMKTKEVLAGNPGMTEDSKIQPGQKIKIVSLSPYLTVMSKGILTKTETVAYNVVTTTDTGLAIGETVVKEQGSDGTKVVTYSYLQKNGQDISKQVIEEKITKQPVTQVVAKGPGLTAVSLARAASRGSGSTTGIAWPLRGPINSPYGYRWGSFHNGLDIGGGTGSSYCAAASGKVVSAGWAGGYGNMILIDHGNGVMTRYAHSSKLLVSVGQQVEQGQRIGLVGSTGHATGPHLHFEVIINGSTVNPSVYLR